MANDQNVTANQGWQTTPQAGYAPQYVSNPVTIPVTHIPGLGFVSRGYQEIANEMQQEAIADKQMQEEFEKKPDAEEGTVDFSAILAVDPSFDEHQFVSIARECFQLVHDARTRQNPDLGKEELSPEEESALQAAITGDQAHQRHHLYPELEIEDARIRGAVVDGGKEHVAVHFWVKGEELERDNQTLQITSGSSSTMLWQELWTLMRDPAVDATAEDRKMTLMENVWWFNHQGWLVEHIQTLTPPAPAPLPGAGAPQLLH